MYQVCADVNNVEYRKVLLDDNFQFSADQLLAAADDHTKMIFLCSPNNPTGNDLLRSEIEKLLKEFEGLVIWMRLIMIFGSTVFLGRVG